MNTRFPILLITALAGTMLAGQAAASPRFMDGEAGWFSAHTERMGREYGKRDEQGMRKSSHAQDRKNTRKTNGREPERGYGYGYERRNPQQGHDERGRR